MPKSRKSVSNILNLLHQSGKKGLAWLIDPDKCQNPIHLVQEFNWIKDTKLDLILIGGSHMSQDNFREVVCSVKKISGKIPVVLFPGSKHQIVGEADAILFLSLISGRNPEYLIGQQVEAATSVASTQLEVLPTAYLLINDGEIKSVHQISQTDPIPNSSVELARATALAGKYLGFKFFFLDAGSGSLHAVSSQVIQSVKEVVNRPVMVGGGIDSFKKLESAFNSGADLVVIGNSIEKDPGFLARVLDYKVWYNNSLNVN
jgi:phosphoglycerol geranylgeranyltransferase